MAISLAKPRLMVFDTMSVSDHNRSELDISVERIENSTRMANGTMRKYVVADKRTFSVSWSMLPNSNNYTVDGFAGADAIENFYNTHAGSFSLVLYYGQNESKNFTVMFTDFSKRLIKRGKFDFYDVDLTMEEV